MEKLSELEGNGNQSQSSEISEEETGFTIRKWKAKKQLKSQQTQPKECTTSTTDIPPMKRRSQSNVSSSSQNPAEEHPKVEVAESSKAKRATSSEASGNKKATKAPVRWTKLHIKKQKEPDADQDKMAQEKSLICNPELSELTSWLSFELVFDDIIWWLDKPTFKQTEIKTRPFFQFRGKK